MDPVPSKPLRVLAVDDCALDLRLLTALLDRAGAEVCTATDGAEALALLTERAFDVVVTDGLMPLVDGYELCRLVKDDPATRHLTVILLTGDQDPLNRLWARICGADHFFVKGPDRRPLLEAVRAARPAQSFEDAAALAPGHARPGSIQGRLAEQLQRRLLETALRNAVADLYEHVHNPEDAAWGLGRVLAELALPGALFVVLPLVRGRRRFILTSADLPDHMLAQHLDVLGEWEDGAHWCRHAAEPCLGAVENLGFHAFLLSDPSGISYGWWGVILPQASLDAYLPLFNAADEEFQRVYRTMILLDQLQEANRRLTRADQAKTDFVRTVSHEIRNPLNAAQAALELLADGDDGPSSPRGRRLLNAAQRSIARMVRLSTGVLDLEKIEAGLFEMELAPLDLKALCAELLEEHQPLAAEKGVRLALEAPEGPLPLLGDRDRLAQCLVNFLSNGLTHSPEGATLLLALAREAGSLRVSVTDQGPGVPSGFQARIFRAFQQAEGQKGGTGLGLAITRALVQRMGGRVGFHNNPGGGATFWFSLPEP